MPPLKLGGKKNEQKEMENYLFEWVQQPLYNDEVKKKVIFINRMIDLKMNKYQRRRTQIHIGFLSLDEHKMLFSGSYAGKSKQKLQTLRMNNQTHIFHKISTFFSTSAQCPFQREKQIIIEKLLQNRGLHIVQHIDVNIKRLSFTYTIETESLDLSIVLEKKISSVVNKEFQ